MENRLPQMKMVAQKKKKVVPKEIQLLKRKIGRPPKMGCLEEKYHASKENMVAQ